MSRRRHRIAWSASIIVHACLIALFFTIFHFLRSQGDDDSQVNTRAGDGDDSPVICLHVDEPFSPPAPIPLPQTIQQPPAKPIEVVKHSETKESTSAASNPANNASIPNATSLPAAGKASAAPLHGKISREGYTVVYVLDHSGSMGRAGKLNKARELLKVSLRQLAPQVRFQIVAYDSEAEPFKLDRGTEAALATSANIARAEDQLEQLVAEGSSRHIEGLRIGLNYRPNMLILLSDADDLSPADAKLVQQWNAKSKTNIHAVILGSPSSAGGVTTLKTVCHQVEGIHFVP